MQMRAKTPCVLQTCFSRDIAHYHK